MQRHEAQLERLYQSRPCFPENTNQACAADKLISLVYFTFIQSESRMTQ